MKRLFYIFAIIIIFVAISADASTRIAYENFDDSQMDDGIYCDSAYEGCGNETYVTGYGGTGKALRQPPVTAGEPDYVLYWEGNWTSDEIFISYKIKYIDHNLCGVSSSVCGDIWNDKWFYNYFFYPDTSSGKGHATDYYKSSWVSSGTLDGSGSRFSSSCSALSASYPCNGQWHQIGVYYKFSTGTFQFYFDGNPCGNTYTGSQRIQDVVIPHLFRIRAPSITATDYANFSYQDPDDCANSFTRLIDDWEIWDGLPSEIEEPTSPPLISNPDPSNGATGVSTSTTYSFDVTDTNGNLDPDLDNHGLFYVTIDNGIGTYYGDTSGVSVSGDTTTYHVTLPALSLAAGTEYTVTIYAENTDGYGDTTEYTFTTVGASGPSDPTCSSHTDGQLLTSSQTVTLNWTSTGATSYSWSCPTCTVTSGSDSTAGTFSFDVTLPTNGLGTELLDSPSFSDSNPWETSGNWSISGGDATYTDGGSGYYLTQYPSVAYFEWVRGCLTPAVGSEGDVGFSMYGLPGIGNTKSLSYTPGSEICEDYVVASSAAGHDIYAICTSEQTMTLSSASLKRIGAPVTITVTATNANGSSISTLHLTHYTAAIESDSYLIPGITYYEENVDLDSNISFGVGNDDTQITEASILATVNGTEYVCADSAVTCSANGNGWDVVIDPASGFARGTIYTVTVDCDYLEQQGWSFWTGGIGAEIHRISLYGAIVYGGAFSLAQEPQDTTNPEISAVTAGEDGTTVTIGFTEDVITDGYDDGDFNLDCDVTGDNIALNSISGSGGQRTFTAASEIQEDETCNLDYTGDSGEITDTSLNTLAGTLTDVSVDNNSEQGQVPVPTIWAQNAASESATSSLPTDHARGMRIKTPTRTLYFGCIESGGEGIAYLSRSVDNPTLDSVFKYMAATNDLWTMNYAYDSDLRFTIWEISDSLYSIVLEMSNVIGSPTLTCRLDDDDDLSADYLEEWTGLTPMASSPLTLTSVATPGLE